MRKEEFYYDSFCNTNKIHAVKWVPEGTPLCIIQIVHGMAEYVERYEEFAAFLTERNKIMEKKLWKIDKGKKWSFLKNFMTASLLPMNL